MVDRNPFNRTVAVRSSMHPASVVRLHLQRVDECLDKAVLLEEVGVAIDAVLADHLHHVRWISQPGRPLNIGENLRIVDVLRDPAHLRPLHGVVEADSLQVIAIRLGVVGELLGKRPAAHVLDHQSREPEECPQVVVGNHGFGRDRRAAADELVAVGIVVGAVKHSPGCDVDEVAC